jgi:hypothetical protein
MYFFHIRTVAEDVSFYLLSYGGLFSHKTRGRNPASERVTIHRTGNGRPADAIPKKTRASDLKRMSVMQRPSVDVCVVVFAAVYRLNLLIQSRLLCQVSK